MNYEILKCWQFGLVPPRLGNVLICLKCLARVACFLQICLYYTILFDFFLAHKLYYALGAVTMLLLVFKFIVGLYIACFNGSRFVAVTFFSAQCRDMRCFYVL